MENRIKLLFAKLTILSAFLALVLATYYFNLQYSLSKSFQLGVLVALGVFVGAAIIFFTLSLLLTPIASRFESNNEEMISNGEESPEESLVIPREKRIIRHSTKEEYIEHSNNERIKAVEVQEKLKEMTLEHGTHAEVMLVLPLELSYLLARESMDKLSFGKITEEDEEAGTILGTAGFGSSPQEIKLSIRTITDHTTAVTILSKSPTQQQSDKKNLTYIKKISDFLRKKEKFYTE